MKLEKITSNGILYKNKMQNNYKNISNKYWRTTFTNTPKFHGLPPGNMASL